jgi:hypothetical protein
VRSGPAEKVLRDSRNGQDREEECFDCYGQVWEYGEKREEEEDGELRDLVKGNDE